MGILAGIAAYGAGFFSAYYLSEAVKCNVEKTKTDLEWLMNNEVILETKFQERIEQMVADGTLNQYIKQQQLINSLTNNQPQQTQRPIFNLN